ncbi:hypothetical protein Hanom_Chr06g00553621 [Helianthus anomalus]
MCVICLCLSIFQADVLITRLTFLYVQMLHPNQLKAKRTCLMKSFGMKTRHGSSQMIELLMTTHQYHKDLKYRKSKVSRA